MHEQQHAEKIITDILLSNIVMAILLANNNLLTHPAKAEKHYHSLVESVRDQLVKT